MKRIRPLHLPAAALAVNVALALGSTAQAQTSSVTIYGLMDACLTSSDLGSSRLKAVNSGCSYGSRLGYRGSEDLGGGNSAYFTLEAGLTIDNGQYGQGGRAFGRKAVLGLGSKSWGSIEAGRDYAPTFYLVQPIDPMALGIGTASSTIWTGAAAGTVSRNDNAVNYISPSWNGVSVRVQVAASEGGTGGARRSKGVNLLYRDSKTIAGIAHGRVADVTGSTEDSATTAAVSYDFGPFSLAAMVQSGSWEATRTAAAPTSGSSIFSRSYRSYLIGGGVPLGGLGKLTVSIKRYDDRTAGNFDFTQATANYVYSLSKRTDLYAAYSQGRNVKLSSYSIADATTTYSGVAAGAKTSLLATGIKHVF